MPATPFALRGRGVVSIAFVVPSQGPTGLYGPSCLACGTLAAEELNRGSGIAGRKVELVSEGAAASSELPSPIPG